jgi:hypothetical protein
MFKANKKIFLEMYLSNKRVEVSVYVEPDRIYIWDDWDDSTQKVEFGYVVSPKTMSKYLKYVKNLEKTCPLLAELV